MLLKVEPSESVGSIVSGEESRYRTRESCGWGGVYRNRTIGSHVGGEEALKSHVNGNV